MNTLLLPIDPIKPDALTIVRAARIIQSGGLVAFPTETVYGLGGNGLDESCAGRIYAAKGRPSDNPLILHIAMWQQLVDLAAEIPESAYILGRHFWPGPLTMVLKKMAIVPDATTGNKQTVAVRMPDHAVALELIRAAGCPLAAPSANLSGKPSPTTAEHVVEDLNGIIPCILDGGPTRIGLESTVIDLSGLEPVILRPGGISLEEIQAVLPNARHAQANDDRSISPGTKYRHYAPKAKVMIVDRKLNPEVSIDYSYQGNKVGWIGESAPTGVHHLIFPNDANFYARYYFAALRDLDQQGADLIVVESIPETGLGAAVMDRIRRSAGYVSA
jgi:L-threonylcarbamoyladenylate synthase